MLKIIAALCQQRLIHKKRSRWMYAELFFMNCEPRACRNISSSSDFICAVLSLYQVTLGVDVPDEEVGSQYEVR